MFTCGVWWCTCVSGLRLKALHVIEPLRPTVVLLGAPNVGKSSIVTAVSSANPEVSNYPFTTRAILRYIYLSHPNLTLI